MRCTPQRLRRRSSSPRPPMTTISGRCRGLLRLELIHWINSSGCRRTAFEVPAMSWMRRRASPTCRRGMEPVPAKAGNPVAGRFLSTDPIGYQDQLNLYAYVGNDPVNKTDPMGERQQKSFEKVPDKRFHEPGGGGRSYKSGSQKSGFCLNHYARGSYTRA